MRTLKLIVTGLFVILLPVVLIQAAYYFKLESNMMTRELSAAELVGDMQKERIEAFAAANLSRLDLVTSRRIFRELLRDYFKSRDKDLQYQLNRSLLDVRYVVPVFDVLSVADPQGQIIASTDNDLIGTSIVRDQAFAEGAKNNAIAVTFPQGEDELHLTLSGPIVMDQTVMAVALLRVQPLELLALLRGPDAVSETDWQLVQRMGTDRMAIIGPASSGTALVARMLDNDDQSQDILDAMQGTEQTAWEDESRVLVTRFIPQVGWAIRMVEDAASIHADLMGFRNVIVLTLLVLAAAITTTSLYCSRFFRQSQSEHGANHP